MARSARAVPGINWDIVKLDSVEFSRHLLKTWWAAPLLHADQEDLPPL